MSSAINVNSNVTSDENDVGKISRIRQIARKILIAPIRIYQIAISPYRNRTCRFYPSCSQYALTAVSKRGVFKGTYLAIRRLLRCHPWTPGGVDHVP